MTTEIPCDEFRRRFIDRIVESSGLDAEEAASVWECCTYAEWTEGGAEPEEAADEEMSYWSDDGDS